MRFPLRLKVSGVIILALVLSIGVIAYLSINLFIQDKSNYIYELSSFTASDRSLAVSSTLDHLQEKMRIFAKTYGMQFSNPEQQRELLESFFRQYQEFFALWIYQEDGSKTLVFKTSQIDKLGIAPESIEQKLQKNGFKFNDVLSQGLWVSNATLEAQLPAFALAVPLAVEGNTGGKRMVVLGVIDLHKIEPSTDHQSSHEVYIVDNRGAIIYHTNPVHILNQDDFSRFEIVQTMFANPKQIRSGSKEFLGPKGEKMLGSFSVIKDGKAGVVVQVPRSVAFEAARTLIKEVSYVAAVILIVAVLISIFLTTSITHPVRELARATRRFARGEFNLRVLAQSRDEIGDLAKSFNFMGEELAVRESALAEANQKLIQSEKMAAFGQLGAGIAHEVKNPLAGILGYAQLAMKKIPEDHAIFKNLSIIEKETKRCKEIIENLLRFARQEKAAYEPININAVVRDAVVLVEHQLTLNKVKIMRKIPDTTTMIVGNANQLQQVLMNLMINAQHAMEPNGGELHISTNVSGDRAEVHVRDTGCGIPEEIRQKIFEPFFTTKPAGKGTGLGLSVTFGIITDHKGEVKIESEVGKGTEFIIRLPVAAADGVKKPAAGAKTATAPATEEVRANV